MSFVASIFNIVLEALFPVSPEERAVLSMDPKQSFEILRRAKKSPILEACGIFSYKDQRMRKLIWSIKYKRSSRGSAFAGYALYHILKSYSNAVSPIIIVPMPITKRRRRERGYNQCELIINEIEKLDTDHRLTFSRNILFRKLHMSRQTLKDRKERLESAKDIFVADVEAIDKLVCKLSIEKLNVEKLDINKSGSNTSKDYLVIVIDDVITTGSTILDAIKTLRKAGLEKTFGLSVAH